MSCFLGIERIQFRKTLDIWQTFDQQNLIIGQFALHTLLERRMAKMRLSSARVNFYIFVHFPTFVLDIQ
jgi:hypothetical protein